MFLQFARLSILRAEKEKNFFDLAHILGPTPGLGKDQPTRLRLPRLQPRMGADGSRSPTNATTCARNSPLTFAMLRRSARSLPMVRADAPTIHLKHRSCSNPVEKLSNRALQKPGKLFPLTH